MKLEKVNNAPEWLKRDPKSGIFWIDIYRANCVPRRLSRTTKEKNSKERAKYIGERMIAKWMGHEIDGGRIRITIREVCVDLLKEMETRVKVGTLRKPTYENARYYVGKFILEEFGHLRPDQIEEYWDRFVIDFQNLNPGKKLYNHWKHVSLVMNKAYKKGYIEKPWSIPCPDARSKAGRVLTDAEKSALLKHARPMLRDQLMFAMTMGMRLREHLHLTWDRVDLENKTITLRPEDTKTNKGRIIKMSPQVFEVLARRYQTRNVSSPYVFPARGKPSQPTNQNKNAWVSAKRAAKIVGRCRYHDLRHTFLSECAKRVRAGSVSLPIICAYAGLNISVFERVYLHLNHNDTAEVSELIAVKLGGEDL